MSSREKILNTIANTQPQSVPLPDNLSYGKDEEGLITIFTRVATGVGSKVVPVDSVDAVKLYIKEHFAEAFRIVSSLPELSDLAEPVEGETGIDPHTFENIDLAILKPQFAVAENGAVWITENSMGHRVIPFICQHLAMVVDKESIVATMHQAYDIIAEAEYGFAAFIAGPSKTADIEQSLVLGAHGPRSMTLFLL